MASRWRIQSCVPSKSLAPLTGNGRGPCHDVEKCITSLCDGWHLVLACQGHLLGSPGRMRLDDRVLGRAGVTAGWVMQKEQGEFQGAKAEQRLSCTYGKAGRQSGTLSISQVELWL